MSPFHILIVFMSLLQAWVFSFWLHSHSLIFVLCSPSLQCSSELCCSAVLRDFYRCQQSSFSYHILLLFLLSRLAFANMPPHQQAMFMQQFNAAMQQRLSQPQFVTLSSPLLVNDAFLTFSHHRPRPPAQNRNHLSRKPSAGKKGKRGRPRRGDDSEIEVRNLFLCCFLFRPLFV